MKKRTSELKKFSDLYGVKTHIISTHETFIKTKVRKKLKLISSEGSIINRKSGKIRKKGKKGKGSGFSAGSAYKSKKFSTKKVRWCNYCWIKFSKNKDYVEHRNLYHRDIIEAKNCNQVHIKSEEQEPGILQHMNISYYI